MADTDKETGQASVETEPVKQDIPLVGGKTTNDIAEMARQALQMSRTSGTPDPLKSRFAKGMRLRLEAIEETNHMVVAVQEGDMVMGRGDTVAAYAPEIDLAPFGAYRLGVSRRHVILRHKDEALFLVDLGSRNGTILNGVQIERDTPKILHHGDEIMMANLRVRVVFEQ